MALFIRSDIVSVSNRLERHLACITGFAEPETEECGKNPNANHLIIRYTAETDRNDSAQRVKRAVIKLLSSGGVCDGRVSSGIFMRVLGLKRGCRGRLYFPKRPSDGPLKRLVNTARPRK